MKSLETQLKEALATVEGLELEIKTMEDDRRIYDPMRRHRDLSERLKQPLPGDVFHLHYEQDKEIISATVRVIFVADGHVWSIRDAIHSVMPTKVFLKRMADLTQKSQALAENERNKWMSESNEQATERIRSDKRKSF